MADIKDLEWIEIFLWYKCNIKCSFCYQKDSRIKYPHSFNNNEVKDLLVDWYKRWKKFVIFSWWEATLDNNLSDYILYAKSLWYEHIRVHSNWFRFKDYDYLFNLYSNWLTWVTLSIHWYWIYHDKITWSMTSFQNLKNALLNFERLRKIDKNFIFDVNSVITKSNYINLNKLAIFLTYFSINRVQFSTQYSMHLYSKEELIPFMPEYKDILPYVIEILDISREFNKKYVVNNIPFCILPKKYWDCIENNIKLIKKDSVTVGEWNTWSTRWRWSYKSEKCSKCKFNNKCLWIPNDYYRVFWDIDVRPIYL